MKEAEKNTSTIATDQINLKREPFFTKGGNEGFFSKSNSQPSFFGPTTIQPKLKIGQPNDKYEAEADSMADQVVSKLDHSPGHSPDKSGSNNVLQTKHTSTSAIQAKCASCDEEDKLQKKEEELSEKDMNVQRKSLDSPLGNSTNVESKLSSSKGRGNPLSPEIQNSMGSAFKSDFSKVRVHTGNEAVQMNKEFSAQAFTHGNDIYFNQGKYNTSSKNGKHLLAHELTHTIQQKNSANRSEIQCSRDHLSTIVGPLGSENEEGQRINLYTMGDGPIMRGTDQIFTLGFTPPHLPDNLSFYWMVIDNSTERPIYSRVTREPTIRIRASNPGSYLVYVSIMQNGRAMVTNTGGSAFLQINQRVGRQNEENNESDSVPANQQGIASHSIPACSGSAIRVNQSFTYRLGEIARPAADCSFTPLFEIPQVAQSVSVRAHAVDPPSGDWRMTLFECPNRLSNRIACDRNFGIANSESGPVSRDLVFNYDPSLWVSRRIFIRIRNGATTPIPNVLLTVTPNYRDPVIQAIHDALSVLGLIPGLGIVPDAVDTAIYLIEGDWGGAVLSAAAMLPAFGQGATVVRIGSRDVIRVHSSEVSRLGQEGIATNLRRIRREAAANPGTAAGTRHRDLDVDVDSTVDAIVEEAGSTSHPGRRGRLRRPSVRGRSRTARTPFNRVRDGYAARLGVPSGGQVHHAIELQVLDRYPDVFTANELNAFENMRGIGTELLNRRQLHNSSVRYHWNRHYRALDAEIARRGLQPGTDAYNDFTRRYLEAARDEIDFIMGQFFTEYRTGSPRVYD